MKKVSIVSHIADLDGVASAVLATEIVMSKYGYAPEQVLFANYDDVKTVIARAAIDADELWILDLSIREPNISEFFKHIPKESVFYFDHHQSSTPVIEAWDDCASIYFDDSGDYCTADLLYEAANNISPRFVKNNATNQLVAATHSRDLWINDVNEGALLTDAIAVLGAKAVYQELIEQPISAFEHKFTPIIQESIAIAKKQRASAMTMASNTKMTIKVNDNCTLIYAIANGYFSEIAHAFLIQNPEAYAMIFDLGRLTCSVRCNSETIEKNGVGANTIASLFHGGGGHPYAAGFPLLPEMAKAILQSGCMSTHNTISRLFRKK
jgi:oligoribonuclease NrnB/cAMP/cGMP phosphodiesterase (DHH superfamily)